MLPSAAGFLCAVPINRTRLGTHDTYSVPPPAKAAPHNMLQGVARITPEIRITWIPKSYRIRARKESVQISIRNRLLVAQKFLPDR